MCRIKFESTSFLPYHFTLLSRAHTHTYLNTDDQLAQEQFGVQCDAQAHFDMEEKSGGGGNLDGQWVMLTTQEEVTWLNKDYFIFRYRSCSRVVLRFPAAIKSNQHLGKKERKKIAVTFTLMWLSEPSYCKWLWGRSRDWTIWWAGKGSKSYTMTFLPGLIFKLGNQDLPQVHVSTLSKTPQDCSHPIKIKSYFF